MRRPRPSLARRLTLAFFLSNALAAFVFILLIMYAFAMIEEDEPIGPELPLLLLESDLTVKPNGELALRRDAEIYDFARSNPRTWFLAEANGRELSFGPVPDNVREQVGTLAGSPFQARYRNLGATGPLGHAVTEEVEIGEAKVVVTTGGVDSGTLTFDNYFGYLIGNDFLWVPLFTAIFNLIGGLIAIPVILRSVRSTARAAAELDPSNLSRRLPQDGVVKELRPLVQAFNLALDRLADAFERRRRFIADVAHELRTPVAVLNMHVESMPEGASKADLQRGVFRLGQMVGQMLDVERLSLSERRREKVDLVELSRAAVAEIAPVAVANGYELAFASARDRVVTKGDPHALARALSNLLGNAVAHGGGTGIIQVRVEADGSILVSDEGPGIAVEARERIFEPFRRERWDRDGCGLGLHLVREIMRAHGGEIRLVGSGPGATFRLDFAHDRAELAAA